mmetsp:Transcript_59372/g.132226  ORF Transcript_59372/g.132226 Transcript_59372/m.132226 type:complete len:221 (+) Transcript_59372:259-921(+)
MSSHATLEAPPTNRDSKRKVRLSSPATWTGRVLCSMSLAMYGVSATLLHPSLLRHIAPSLPLGLDGDAPQPSPTGAAASLQAGTPPSPNVSSFPVSSFPVASLPVSSLPLMSLLSRPFLSLPLLPLPASSFLSRASCLFPPTRLSATESRKRNHPPTTTGVAASFKAGSRPSRSSCSSRGWESGPARSRHCWLRCLRGGQRHRGRGALGRACCIAHAHCR